MRATKKSFKPHEGCGCLMCIAEGAASRAVTGEVRWHRPRGGTDNDIRLEQLFERVTGERDWRPVRTVLED